MLYISRYIYKDSFGVGDTDDGVEEIVSRDNLEEICCTWLVPIEGVQIYWDSFMRYITSTCTYQPVETMSQLQIKTKVLKGIEVHTLGSMVTNILWNKDDILLPVRIRLSDFGDCCGECILSGNRHSRLHQVTLVLDDKISFGQKVFKLRSSDDTFLGRDGVGVMLDLREITDDAVAERAYRAYYTGNPSILFGSIIDHEERKERMKKVVR